MYNYAETLGNLLEHYRTTKRNENIDPDLDGVIAVLIGSGMRSFFVDYPSFNMRLSNTCSQETHGFQFHPPVDVGQFTPKGVLVESENRMIKTPQEWYVYLATLILLIWKEGNDCKAEFDFIFNTQDPTLPVKPQE